MTMAVSMTDVVVRDGSTVCLRQADRRRCRGVAAVPAVAVAGEPVLPVSWASGAHRVRVRALIGLDGSPATTLVAESGGRIVAFAGYYRNPMLRDRAEVAFAVSDAVQGHGIGTRLLEQLATIAREAGHQRRLTRTCSATTVGCSTCFASQDWRRRFDFERGVCHVVLSLAVTDQLRRTSRCAIADRRDRIDARVLRAAGRGRGRRQPERGKIGSEILNNLLAAGFTGHGCARAPNRDARSPGCPRIDA